MRNTPLPGVLGFLLSLTTAALLAGCTTVKRVAIGQLGNALAGGGTTFAADDDPELIKSAAPFSLKLIESLLAQSPNHAGLLLAACSGFTQYAFAFVEPEADEIERTDLAAALEKRARAKKLYLRARDYGLRALEVRQPDFTTLIQKDPAKALARLRASDAPALYWTAAAWGSAISLSKDNADLVADLPAVERLIDRALELDESMDHGAIHSFLITYEMSRPGAAGDPADRARGHFQRAVELSGGLSAGPYVAFAESVCIPVQDAAQFEKLLRQALAIDPDAHPADRLANLVMQRRARWLLAQKSELFLSPQ